MNRSKMFANFRQDGNDAYHDFALDSKLSASERTQNSFPIS